MGFIETVKRVVSKLRAAGKTEKEVSEIIEKTSEAATVTRKAEKPEIQKIEIVANGESLKNALERVGITAKEAISALERMNKAGKLQRSNNWRKMHGLPMRRRCGRRKRSGKGKRADRNRKNGHIS